MFFSISTLHSIQIIVLLGIKLNCLNSHHLVPLPDDDDDDDYDKHLEPAKATSNEVREPEQSLKCTALSNYALSFNFIDDFQN